MISRLPSERIRALSPVRYILGAIRRREGIFGEALFRLLGQADVAAREAITADEQLPGLALGDLLALSRPGDRDGPGPSERRPRSTWTPGSRPVRPGYPRRPRGSRYSCRRSWRRALGNSSMARLGERAGHDLAVQPQRLNVRGPLAHSPDPLALDPVSRREGVMRVSVIPYSSRKRIRALGIVNDVVGNNDRRCPTQGAAAASPR